MPDFGAHSVECATADGGTCYCDCNGTMHGITHAGGSLARMAEVTITKLHGGGFKVTDPATGLPLGGGTTREKATARRDAPKVVTNAALTRQLSPGLQQHVSEVRARLPKTRDEWRSAIVKTPAELGAGQAYRDSIARTRAKLAEKEAEYNRLKTAWEAEHKASFDADPYFKGKRNAKMREDFLANLERSWGAQSIAYYREDLERDQARLDEILAGPAVRVYPRTSDGRNKAPDEWNAHLDAVMAVGRSTLAEARKSFAADPEWKRRRDAAESWEAGEYARATDEWKVADKAAWESGKMSGALADKHLRHPVGQPITDPDLKAFFDRRDAARAAESKAAAAKRDAFTELRKRKAALAEYEQGILLDMLASSRDMSGNHTDPIYLTEREREGANGKAGKWDPLPARADHAEVHRRAERFYPADWIAASDARGKLRLGTANRAFYRDRDGTLLTNKTGDEANYTGGHGIGEQAAAVDVQVHEMGHRMEKSVPGLTQLEMAFVLRRSTAHDGELEKAKHMAGYSDKTEVSYHDTWADPYAGKTYQQWDGGDPGSAAWEVFQVGMQDTFSRKTQFDKSDDLQAFTLGALLTLA